MKTNQVSTQNSRRPALPQTKKVTMAWNYTWESALDRISNLDIISPNWFVMDRSLGIKDEGSPDYVHAAHDKGLQVQPRLEGPMIANWGAATILLDRAKRQTIIDNLLSIIGKYKNQGAPLDGINLDFEAIGPQSKHGYSQFVQELSMVLKAGGLTLSIDVPGLTSYTGTNGVWNGGFDLPALGRITHLDHIIIMAYDWTYGAPKNYVQDALTYAADRIPNHKIVLGVPLFSRDYKRDPKGFNSPWGPISRHRAYYHTDALATINSPGANPQAVWMDDFGLTKVTYLQQGVQHIMFLEDSKSLAQKLDLVNKFDIAGMAAWRLKEEDPDIYAVIGEKMGKTPISI